MMRSIFERGKWIPPVVIALGLVSCAGDKADPSRPTAETGPKPMSQRLSESGGYKQDEEGNWIPKSDKRSQYDSNRESAYFKGKVETDRYQTGEYKKKTWLGGKDYGKQAYAGNTDGSRFQTKARQDGQRSRDAGKAAKVAGPFETNTLDRENAREGSFSGVARPSNEVVDARRGKYKAPSVIDWQEQRGMSMDQSRGILGR